MALRPSDLGPTPRAARTRGRLLARLGPDELDRLLAHAELQRLPARTRVHGDADAGRHLYLVLEGEALWRREQLPLRRLGPGDHFGELSALGERHLGEVVSSDGPLLVARLSPAAFGALERAAPAVALKLALGLADELGREVARLTGDMGTLLRGRSLPRASTVKVTVL
ncbi:MAG: cyclic nucleotide-binding domain-containing protein, partial [Anaeromyxobacteraceae bacterium]|nr:cyclic nucleotide-binding domain-containing protein [Anaeromyxobacteraceae bacterium]